MARFKHAGDDAAAGNHAPLSADVLVVGGGPAGTWAAIKAAQAGADVVLVDKGRCGSSGATASVGTGIWYVEDEPELREAAMASREALGGPPRRPRLDGPGPRRDLRQDGRARPHTTVPVPRRRPRPPDPRRSPGPRVHRVPPATARTIDQLRSAGRLSVLCGRVIAVSDKPTGMRVRIEQDARVVEVAAGWLINATGPAADVTATTDPLLRGLLESGLARPDSLRLGIEADARGALLNVSGTASNIVFTLGPPLRGNCTRPPPFRRSATKLPRSRADRWPHATRKLRLRQRRAWREAQLRSRNDVLRLPPGHRDRAPRPTQYPDGPGLAGGGSAVVSTMGIAVKAGPRRRLYRTASASRPIWSGEAVVGTNMSSSQPTEANASA